VHDVLLSCYGPQNWWPGETQFEIIVGAVLTQNTAWANVTRAIANLREAGLLSLPALSSATPERVRELIRPSGFYNVKQRRLSHLLRYLEGHARDWTRFGAMALSALRNELLDIDGIGPETADSILLYAFGRETFVVDAYTRRLWSRLGEAWALTCPYETLQSRIASAIPPTATYYNEFHALIVVHGKVHCRASPRCAGCPLDRQCPARSDPQHATDPDV
jgi:endonuclease-3 related protein